MARLAIRPQSFLNMHFCFQWSLDKGWRIVHPKNNDHWTQDVHPGARRFWATFPGHGYEQGVCQKNSSRSCIRGMSNPITSYHKNSSSNWEIEKEEEERKAKACALEKKEASDSLYCTPIRRRNHIAISRSREEGSNLKWGGPKGVAFL
jgi:hypothetical protein